MVRNVCFTGGRFHNDCFPDVSFFFFFICALLSLLEFWVFLVMCVVLFVFFYLFFLIYIFSKLAFVLEEFTDL